MVGGHKTHDYPYGKPFPLILLAVGMAILALSWVVLVPGHWPRAIGLIAAVIVFAFIDGRLHKRYEQTGLAVRIRRPPQVVAKFLHSLPVPMLVARLAFFVTVAGMIVFGVAPVRESTARIGIIACVFTLIGVAILNLALERHYVNTGVATEIDVSSNGKPEA
jgi:hypothetical protein